MMDEPYTLIGPEEAKHILETHQPGDYPDRCPECNYTRWPCSVADLAATVIALAAEVAELREAVRVADAVADKCVWTEIYEPPPERSIQAEHCLMCNCTNGHLTTCEYVALNDALNLPAVKRALEE